MSEVERLRAVVAAQREALRQIAAIRTRGGNEAVQLANVRMRARAALDAEEVSEPWAGDGSQVEFESRAPQGQLRASDATPGSLTSPVARYDHETNRWDPRCPYGDLCTACDAAGKCERAPLTSPVDTAPGAKP